MRTSADFRGEFPMLERTVHLASCSLGARSAAVDASLQRMLGAMGDAGTPWRQFEEEADTARRGFASLIGARPDQVALIPSASAGAYQVVSTLNLSRRDTVVTTDGEFPSVAHVWLAQRPRGLRVVFTDDYEKAVDDRTALVSVPLVTFQQGRKLPVADVTASARASGARSFVDAYQAAGVLPIDVEALGCDYLVAGAMKYVLGLPGVAFLYARSASDRDPVFTGWFGRVNPFAFDARQLDFPATARRFETGTPAVPALYAANAAMGLIGSLDLTAVERHVGSLTEYAADTLTAQGERVSLPDRRGAHIGLADDDPTILATFLSTRGIAVSPRGPVARLAFHYFNNAEDVDTLCAAINEFRKAA